MTSRRLADRFPDFPWDTLRDAKERALAHPDGVVNLSIGTPVDPTPGIAIEALTGAADSPGYPSVVGVPELGKAMANYLRRRWAAELDPSATLPVLGTKELIAQLPNQLGFGPGDRVVIPSRAYPTYAVGANVTDSTLEVADDLSNVAPPTGDERVLVWINSPSNPTGETLPAAELTRRVEWAREHGALLASDECYGEFGWEADPASVLDPAVNGGSLTGILALHSLSKRSNLAGYRAGLVAGDPEWISELLEVRKHLGMMMPAPIQHAMIALLDDQEHVEQQRQRYLHRRSVLRPALESAGFRIEHSESGLYLWCTRGEPGRASVEFLADAGILVAPGDFYGTDCGDFVRVALTATDERIETAARRLTD